MCTQSTYFLEANMTSWQWKQTSELDRSSRCLCARMAATQMQHQNLEPDIWIGQLML